MIDKVLKASSYKLEIGRELYSTILDIVKVSHLIDPSKGILCYTIGKLLAVSKLN